MALVTEGPKGVCPFARGDGLEQAGFGAADVVDLDPITTGQAHHQVFVIGCAIHIGGHRTHRGACGQGLGVQVDRDDLVAVLHRHPNGLAAAVDPQVAGCFACGNAFGQMRVLAIPAVNVHMVQAVGGRDKPLHVGRKTQVVGVQNAGDRALHLGGARVNEGEGIAHGVGHDQRFLIGGQIQVVRLFAGRDALFLRPCDGIDHTHVAVERVENKHRGWLLGQHRACKTGPKNTKQKSGKCTKTDHWRAFKIALKCNPHSLWNSDAAVYPSKNKHSRHWP